MYVEVVIERIRQRYGLGRVRGSTRDRVEHALQVAERDDKIKRSGQFIWTGGDQLKTGAPKAGGRKNRACS